MVGQGTVIPDITVVGNHARPSRLNVVSQCERLKQPAQGCCSTVFSSPISLIFITTIGTVTRRIELKINITGLSRVTASIQRLHLSSSEECVHSACSEQPTQSVRPSQDAKSRTPLKGVHAVILHHLRLTFRVQGRDFRISTHPSLARVVPRKRAFFMRTLLSPRQFSRLRIVDRETCVYVSGFLSSAGEIVVSINIVFIIADDLGWNERAGYET